MDEKNFENMTNPVTPEEPVEEIKTDAEAAAPEETAAEVTAAEAVAETTTDAAAAAAETTTAETTAPEAVTETAEAASEAVAQDPDSTLSLDEMPKEETGTITEEDIFGSSRDAETETVSAETSGATAGETPSYRSAASSETYGTSESYNSGSTYSQQAQQSSYSSQNSYGNQSSYGGGAGAYQYAAQNAGYGRAHHAPGYITKRAFVLILILAMLFTMLTSVFITAAYTTYLTNKTKTDGHATNYTLTTSDESLSYKSIIEKSQDSVVSITTESVTNDMWLQNYVTQGAGSGVIIQSDGYIITCEHVISGARKVTVTLRNGKEYNAEIIGADADNDIAVIKIDAKNLQEATYGDSSKLVVGDQVIAIGNPLGTLSGTATTGIISALNRNLTIDNRTLNLFQTDASINPGNSGGGMFDTSGNLIGIVEAKSTGSDIDGLGFATPINKAAKIAKEIIETGKDIKSKGGSSSTKQNVIIGIMVVPVDEQTAKEYGYTHGGLLIKSVNSQEANTAGLQSGDIIFKADGKTIKTNEDLAAILADKKEGDSVKLSIARENGLTSVISTKLISASSTY